MLFKKDLLIGLVDNDYDEAEFDIKEKKIVDVSRWQVHYELIFQYDGLYYQTYYTEGATEYQDESPYEYDKDEIECPEMIACHEMATVYRKKDS